MAGPYDVLVVQNADSGDEKELADAIENLGHTVTRVLDTVAGSTSGYDVVVLGQNARPDIDAPSNGDYHRAPNMPVMITQRGASSTLGIASSSPALVITDSIKWISDADVDWSGQTVGDQPVITTASGYFRSLTETALLGDHAKFLTRTGGGSFDVAVVGAFWAAGGQNGNSDTLGANMIWTCAAHNNWHQLNTAGEALLDGMLDALVGTVAGVGGAPVSAADGTFAIKPLAAYDGAAFVEKPTRVWGGVAWIPA